MKKPGRRLVAGLSLLALGACAVVAAQRGIGAWDVLFAIVLFFWVGLPVLVGIALLWAQARPVFASLRRPASSIGLAETDLLT